MRESAHLDRAEIQGESDKNPETWPELKEHLIKAVGERAEFVDGTFFPLSIKGRNGFAVTNVDKEKHRAQIVASYQTRDAKGRPIMSHLTLRLFRDAGGLMQMTGDKIPPSLGVPKEVLLESICEALERFNPNLWLLFEEEEKEKVGGVPQGPGNAEGRGPIPVDMRRIEFLQNQAGLECAITMAGLSQIEKFEGLEDPKKEDAIKASKLSGYCYFVFPKGAIWDSAICQNAPYFFLFPKTLSERQIRDIMLNKELDLSEKKSQVKEILEKTGLLAEMIKSKPRLIGENKRWRAKHPDINADEAMRDAWYTQLQEFITSTLR